MANTDFDPRAQPPPMFSGNNLLGTAQGMFGGLRRGFQAGNRALHPYSNRLMLAGLGMLGGGPSDAMKGLVAGSALDTEDADKRNLNKAIQALQNDPDSTMFAGMSQPEIDIITSDKDTFGQFVANRTRPADMPSSWDEYVLTTDNPTKEGFNAFLDKKGARSGVSIYTGDYKVPPKYRYKDPNNPDAGVELIPGVATDRSESEQKGDVLLATVEPDYQTALTTYGALNDPVGLAASYGGNLGRYFQSGEFQSGSDAITSIAQSYIYAISGAQAPEQEVRRIAQLVMPALNDKDQTLKLKKQRLGAMVQAIRAKTGAPPLVSPDDPLGIL